MRTAVPGTEDQTRTVGLRTGDRESKDGRPDEERKFEDGGPEVFGQEDRGRTGVPVDKRPDKDRWYVRKEDQDRGGPDEEGTEIARRDRGGGMGGVRIHNSQAFWKHSKQYS
jgi:hypothetical protein